MWFKERVFSVQLRYPAFLIIVIALALFINPAKVRAATYTISDTDDLQAVIDGAADLDTIQLQPGTYIPAVAGESFEIRSKHLTIIGLGAPDNTTVQGNGWRVFLIEESTVVMENLTITGGDLLDVDAIGAGIYQDGGELTLTNCKIEENGSETTWIGGGVGVSGGELTMTGCTIRGNDSIITPGIFSEDSTLTITDSTISENIAWDLDGDADPFRCENAYIYGAGGGVGAFYSEVNISHTTISDNKGVDAGGLGLTNSTFDVADSFITSNTSICQGGGVYLYAGQGTIRTTEINLNTTEDFFYGEGGGLFSDASKLEIVETLVSGNESAIDGGGLFIQDTIASVSNSTISDNKAEINPFGFGGGIAVTYGTTATVSKSTISGNSAYVGGGGVYVDLSPYGGGFGQSLNHMMSPARRSYADHQEDQAKSVFYSCLIMNNSTVSGNAAISTEVEESIGGGLLIGGRAYVNFSTITDNTSRAGGGVYAAEDSRLYLNSTIVAGNTAGEDGPEWYDEGTVSALFSSGGNLIGDNTDSKIVAGSPNADGDYVGDTGSPIDPRLGLLAENGGPTKTHALLLTPLVSPAIDTAVGCMDQDQRGFVRPYPGDGACDIGAFEYLGTADLSLTKDVDQENPLVGDQIIYTLSITNGGPDQASGVTVTDLLPSGLTYVSDDGGGDYDPDTGLWTVGYLNVSQTADLNILVQVDQSGSITNTAAAGSATTDGSPAEDDAVINASEREGVTLTLTKTVDDNTPDVGSDIVYTLTVANTGDTTAETVRVTDLLPAGLAYQGHSPSENYDDQTGIWTVGDLNAGGSRSLDITAEVTLTGTITNRATALSTTSGANSPTASVNIAASKTVDLKLTKTVNHGTPLVGEQVVYTLRVGNDGPHQAEAVRVSDLLPTGLTYVSHTGPGTYDSVSGLWTVGNLNQDEYRELEITARVDLPGTMTNTATAFSSTVDADSPTASVDITATDDKTIDLALTKTVAPNTASVGDQVVYTLTVANNSLEKAENVKVSDYLPTGLTHVSDDGSGSYVPGTGLWNLGDLDGGASRVLKITAEVTLPGTITNTATAFSTTVGANSPTAGVDITATDDRTVVLALDKTVSQSSVNVGDQVVYTLAIANNGSDPAENVVVSDLLPTGLSHVSDTGATSYDPATGLWTVGHLDAAANRQLQITAQVDLPGTITNTATAFSTTVGANSPTAGVDISATAEITVNLALSATIDPAAPDVGDQVVCTLTVENNGPNPAENVQVADLLPTGLAYLSDDGSGSYDPATGLWNVGAMIVSESRELKITAQVTHSGTISNTAVAFSNSPGSNSPSVRVDVVVTPICDVTLALSKAVNDNRPRVGDRVTYTLTVTNQGTDLAEQVAVSDLLPAGLTYVSDNSGGDYVPATGIWAVGDLAASGSAGLEITAEVTLSGTITNTATAFSANSGSHCANARVDIAVPQVQDQSLFLMKTVNKTSPVIGDQIVYTLTIAYLASVQGQGIRVVDQLPAGLTYVSDDSGNAYDSESGEWTIGSMNQYDTRQLQITALVNQTGAITNTATAYSDTPGGNPVDAGVQILAVEEAAVILGLTKTVDNFNPEVGTQATFTLTVANEGGNEVQQVNVVDYLPSTVSYVSDDSAGDYDAGTGIWTVGDLDAGETRQLNIVVEAKVVGMVINTATAYSTAAGAMPVTSSTLIAVWNEESREQAKKGGGGCFIRCLQ